MMSAWIMSIVGIICLGLLVEIVLPKGKVAKYVKGAFSLVVVAVIVAPLPSVFGNEWKIDFDLSRFQVDSTFVDSTISRWNKKSTDEIEKYLYECGYDAQVSISFEDKSLKNIERVDVLVNLSNFKQEVWNDVLQNVKKEIVKKFLIEKEKVFVT